MIANELRARGIRERPSQNAEIALYGVYEISKILTKPERLEVTLTQVLRLLSSFLDMRHGLIALLDDALDGIKQFAPDNGLERGVFEG